MGNVQSVKMGPGCEEVILWDNDGDCKWLGADTENYDGDSGFFLSTYDNLRLTQSANELPWDLRDDMCKITIGPKYRGAFALCSSCFH